MKNYYFTISLKSDSQTIFKDFYVIITGCVQLINNFFINFRLTIFLNSKGLNYFDKRKNYLTKLGNR